MKLTLISDTHLPVRAKQLPPSVWAAVESADVVVHAGDWISVDLLDELTERSAYLIGCWGNNDGPELRRRLPEVARETLDGLRLAVVHETGAAQGRARRCERAYPDTDLLVFGHSHIPWDSTTDSGLRLLNPGSPTDRRRQPHHTYQTATITAGRLTNVALHNV